MAVMFGVINPLNLSGGDITERLEQYLVANKIGDEGQKMAIFITVIGDDTYSLLRNICQAKYKKCEGFVRHVNKPLATETDCYCGERKILRKNAK